MPLLLNIRVLDSLGQVVTSDAVGGRLEVQAVIDGPDQPTLRGQVAAVSAAGGMIQLSYLVCWVGSVEVQAVIDGPDQPTLCGQMLAVSAAAGISGMGGSVSKRSA